MKKILGYIFLVFFALVSMNYISTQLGNFLPHGLARADQLFTGTGGNGLSSIDFSFFDKNGIGKSFITQGYGRTSASYLYLNDWHNGIDIAAVYGAPIYSPTAGTVIATGNQDNYCPRIAFGKYVVLDDPVNHLVLLFAHLGTISVSPGDTLKKDGLIGGVGATGFETGTHLHFSIFKEDGFSMAPAHGCGPYPDGHDVNPFNYLGTMYQ